MTVNKEVSLREFYESLKLRHKKEKQDLIKEFVEDLESSLSFWNGRAHAKTGVVEDILNKWKVRREE